jgi:two-component system, NtrC family, nitrogen regulation sensor histidine kinase NtrY
VKTIQKRSNGLYDFVNEYRKLTKVPPPRVEKVKAKSLIENVVKLMQSTISENHIKISYQINPEDLIIALDPNLIEQVLINLVKNAIEALSETKNAKINITAGLENEHPYISISDNGPGIEPEIMDEVFVPFFTTREEGSGIGLSLSRQIMRLHNGSISVQLKISDTSFLLLFPSN